MGKTCVKMPVSFLMQSKILSNLYLSSKNIAPYSFIKIYDHGLTYKRSLRMAEPFHAEDLPGFYLTDVSVNFATTEFEYVAPAFTLTQGFTLAVARSRMRLTFELGD